MAECERLDFRHVVHSLCDAGGVGEQIMIERNTKKLLLEAVNKTGDNPEDVSCTYSRGFFRHGEGPVLTMPSCLAVDLPDGELQTDREIKIETSPNTDPS